MPANIQESRIILVIEAIRSTKRMSLRAVAKTYDVPKSSLRYRIKGRVVKYEKRNAAHNLIESEEETFVCYILDLDSRGFPPRIERVKDMADLLLMMRGAKCVGKQ